ncbi:hypothetical protein ACFVVM_33080 [Nocardia sp. NPDC058176]|uniref:hypothetical protein n=1 Tax=Nocardia sp. NPDC058176 TaxID=3346368 RepID=UPI0036DAD43B
MSDNDFPAALLALVPAFSWPGSSPGPECSAPDCPREVRARGLCRRHYDAWYNRQSLDPAYRSYGRTDCAEPGCTSPHHARGWCSAHYMRRYKAREFDIA